MKCEGKENRFIITETILMQLFHNSFIDGLNFAVEVDKMLGEGLPEEKIKQIAWDNAESKARGVLNLYIEKAREALEEKGEVATLIIKDATVN